jgi:hypothetical protein
MINKIYDQKRLKTNYWMWKDRRIQSIRFYTTHTNGPTDRDFHHLVLPFALYNDKKTKEQKLHYFLS